jgi:hypothetical protein
LSCAGTSSTCLPVYVIFMVKSLFLYNAIADEGIGRGGAETQRKTRRNVRQRSSPLTFPWRTLSACRVETHLDTLSLAQRPRIEKSLDAARRSACATLAAQVFLSHSATDTVAKALRFLCVFASLRGKNDN